MALLKASNTTAGTRVFGGRKLPYQSELFPAISVFAGDETMQGELYTGYTQRTFELVVVAVTSSKPNSQDFDTDEIAENVLLEIETVMSQVFTSETIDAYGLKLFEEISPIGNEIELDTQSGRDIGRVIARYQVVYNYQHPIVPVELVDFDIENSIKNLTITNEGVPSNV